MSEKAESLPADTPLRVAWVAGRDTLSNFGRTLNPLAVGLMDELVELTLLVPHDVDANELPAPAMEVVRYAPVRWGYSKRTVRTLIDPVRSRKVELLHSLDSSVVKLTRDLGREARIRYVVSSYAQSDAWRFGRLGPPCVGVLAGCERIESKLLRHHVAAGANIHLIRPGVHQVKHATCFRDPQQSVVVVASGRGRSWKAGSGLLDSFAELKRRGSECAFVVIGAGAMERALRKRTASLGLQHEVTFAGDQTSSQFSDIMKAADLYISPGAPGMLDFWVLLAMAGGVPVLTGSDKEDFILDGRTALVFKPSSRKDLTAKLISLLEDRAAARELGEGALGHLREHHSPAGMVARVKEIYRHVAS